MTLSVLGNRADLVSGGDALVRIGVERGAAGLRVDVGGRDVTKAFARRPHGKVEGLLTGLRVGTNVVRARLADGRGATLTITNHPQGGVLARDEYRIAVLYEPGKPFTPWQPQPGFNRKLVITHGASCDTSYEAGTAPDVLLEDVLGAGYVVMSHALDNAGHNCNLVTQAESLVMTKEKVVEQLVRCQQRRHPVRPVRPAVGAADAGAVRRRERQGRLA